MDFLDEGRRFPFKIKGRIFFFRVAHINQMMHGKGPFLGGWFGRSNVHTTENKHGITGDDFPFELLGKKNSTGCLSCRCWSEDDNDFFFCGHGILLMIPYLMRL